jgi:hypothetical protein
MKMLLLRGTFLTLLFLTMLFSVAGSAQEPGKAMLPLHGPIEIQAPNPKGADPKPGDAERTLLAAFGRYEVVGMSAAHGNKDLDDFILHLIRNPAFPSRVKEALRYACCSNAQIISDAAGFVRNRRCAFRARSITTTTCVQLRRRWRK